MALTTLPCATALACDISIYTLLYFTLLYFTLLYLTFFFFCFVTKPTDETTEPICTHDISNDADCSKEVPFRGLIDETIFSRWNIPSPKFSKGILHANRKSRISLDR
jgi:hypothetical protein